MTFSYLWPIAAIILSNVVYNITTKNTPGQVNAFLSLGITYITAAVVSLLIFAFTSEKTVSLKEQLSQLNWTSFVLGLSIIGLELGYIFAFRAGWKVNMTSVVANITLAVVLIFVGYFLFKESISLKQIAGIAVCFAGLILLSR